MEAGARNFALGALTPEGSVDSNVSVPVVAAVPAGNVTDPETGLNIFGSVTVDAAVENEAVSVTMAGG